MKKTALYEKHLESNAKMVDFAGWSMPISYGSLKDEILSVRKDCGVFDVSHMGEFLVEGEGANDFIQELIPNDFNVKVGKAVYSPLLNDEGKMLDDLIVYKLSEKKILICVNAANINKDWKWISHVHERLDKNCFLENVSENYSLLAVQGPKTEEILSSIFQESIFEELSYYGVQQFENSRGDWIIARTGYTGEDGFELFCSHEQANWIWGELLKEGVKPIGLGARDTLRLEVCFPLYGNELNEELTPYDAGLRWTVKKDKESFIGKEKLLSSKPTYRLAKLSLNKGIPRSGYSVANKEGEVIGKVTSGTMSPHLNKGIALALINKNNFPDDNFFQIIIRDKFYEAEYHKKPFVAGGHK